jgi:hypothetical protein
MNCFFGQTCGYGWREGGCQIVHCLPRSCRTGATGTPCVSWGCAGTVVVSKGRAGGSGSGGAGLLVGVVPGAFVGVSRAGWLPGGLGNDGSCSVERWVLYRAARHGSS